MTIIVKNKDTLIYDDFIFRCCVGKNGFARNKIEGDNKTPIGIFSLEFIYYRSDKKNKPITNLKSLKIKNNMGWCNDLKSKKKYNRIVNTKTKFSTSCLSDNSKILFKPITLLYIAVLGFSSTMSTCL